MSSRFVVPFADVGDGISPADGAKLDFFDSGTSNRKDTYSDESLTTANANPVIADADGVFGDIWMEDGDRYKVALNDKNDVQIWETDPVKAGSSSGADFDTVADMVADVGLEIGDSVRTLGYNTKGDGGANSYTIVAAGTGTNDGGKYINLSGVTGQARGDFVGELVNVIQFGATGDGATDDTSALNNATAYVGVAGGNVDVPPGIYSINATVDIPAGVNLVGQNRSALLRSDTSITRVLRFTGDDAAITGFTIDGNNNATSYIVEFQTGVNRCSFVDNEITNTGADNTTSSGGVVMVETRDATVDNNVVGNYFHDCSVGLRINKNTKNLLVKNNTFDNWGLRGIWCRGESPAPSHINIIENWFGVPLAGDIKTPIAFDKVTADIQYVMIVNNVLTGPFLAHDSTDPTSNTATSDMISLHGVRFFQVLGNILTGGGEVGITVSQGCISGLVANNIVNFIDINGISIGSASGDTTRRVAAVNNHIENVSQDLIGGTASKNLSGISFTNTHSCYADGNYIIDSQGTPTMAHGIVVEDSTNIGRGTNWMTGFSSTDWLYQGTNIFLEADHFERTETSPLFSTLTLASNSITVLGKYHRIDTEASGATDNLDTINGGVDGMEITLRTTSDARDVVLRDGVDNIYLGNTGGNLTLSDTTKTVTLLYDGILSAWLEK